MYNQFWDYTWICLIIKPKYLVWNSSAPCRREAVSGGLSSWKYTIICLHCNTYTNNRCPPRPCTCPTKLVGVWWWPQVIHFRALGPWHQAWTAVRLYSRTLERRGLYPRGGWWAHVSSRKLQMSATCLLAHLGAPLTAATKCLYREYVASAIA